MKRGLIIGKFMPIHKGHMALIDFGAKHCDELTVFVCTRKGEAVEGRLRYQWVKSLYKSYKNIKVKWISKELHESDLSLEKATKLWGEYLIEHYGSFDYIFSSEGYGDYLAKAMDVKHILFDISRDNIPISATMIRSNPGAYWDYIPDVVKNYYYTEKNIRSKIIRKMVYSLLGVLVLKKMRHHLYE